MNHYPKQTLRLLLPALLISLLPLLSLSAQECGCRPGEAPFVTSESALDSIAELTKEGYSFIVLNDQNRFGMYGQLKGAWTLGDVAEAVDAEFIVSNGDIFHYLGAASVDDPVFRTGFEDIYTHPETHIPWYVVLGNHEHKGNGQALIDYSRISSRWRMPDFYYSVSIGEPDEVTADLFLIDTPSLIDKYRDNPEEYPQSIKISREEQLAWLDSALSVSTADFKIVLGHHPVYADTSKDEVEREDMQKYILPILKKHNVDLYLNGHIHNFQVIRRQGEPTLYVTNSTISKTRKVKPIEGTRFASDSQGMIVVNVTKEGCNLYLIDNDAHLLHTEHLPRP